MLKRVTEEEAFLVACKVAGTHSESLWALNLRAGEDLKDIFYDSLAFGRADGPEFVAVCTYFAVKAGICVVREATPEEQHEDWAERMDDLAAGVWG